ncbi:MAG: NfeD family protein [Clostridia bacterium]|nr:NfeD family protein [Clostridia bacterium]
MLKYIWLALFVILLVVEGLGPGLICLWFAFGALIAFVCSLSGASLIVQIIAFALSSLLFVLLLRPLALRYVNAKKTATNADAVIGKEGVVIREIDELKGEGQVKIAGQVWTARSEDGSVIAVDTIVRACGIQGAKLMVTPNRAGESQR